jgi:hypothetical protein
MSIKGCHKKIKIVIIRGNIMKNKKVIMARFLNGLKNR